MNTIRRSMGWLLASNDHIYLIADFRQEAYLLEVCGRYWALLECVHTRGNSDRCGHDSPGTGVVWLRARGLPSSSKVGGKTTAARSTWCAARPRSTIAQARSETLGPCQFGPAQQQGAIDLHYPTCRMLSDHYVTNRDMLLVRKVNTLANSFLVDLQDNEQPLLAWVAFGTPAVAGLFPDLLGRRVACRPVLHTGSPTIQDRTQEFPQKLALGTVKRTEQAHVILERLQTKSSTRRQTILSLATHHIAGVQHGFDRPSWRRK